MSRTIHVGIDVKGVLMNWRAREWVNVCRDESGNFMTPDAVKAHFLDQLAQGHLRYPYGEPCEGWSWTTGCPGHEATS